MADLKDKREHFLKGVHFGVNDRTLLLEAPSPYALAGLPVRMPGGSRSDNQALQRSARKLRRLGLVFLEHLPEAGRAHDPRGARPFYEDGRFWLREDPTRLQRVKRAVIWATPLGEGIRLNYQESLGTGGSRRWREADIARAERYAHLHPVDPVSRRAAIEETARKLNPDPPPGPEPGKKEAKPPEVRTKVELVRWRLAARAAKKTSPRLGSERLWEEALELFRGTLGDEELRRAAGTEKKPTGRTPRLRNRFYGPTPTASELRRRQAAQE